MAEDLRSTDNGGNEGAVMGQDDLQFVRKIHENYPLLVFANA